MKKLVFTVALCFVVSMAFAQKKAISAAKNEIKGNKPNIEEARKLIQGAMEDPETKNNAETYFVAGQIENSQFDAEKIKEALGQAPNEAVMYKSLGNILPFFLKADELDQLPDEKGKVKPKFRKDLKSYITANHPYYRNGGVYYSNNMKDYAEAYKFFDIYLNIPKLPMFEGDKAMEAIVSDSSYLEIKYYAAIMASSIGTDESRRNAIALYESLVAIDYNSNEVYQYLCAEYEQIKDSVNLVKILKKGASKFPDEPYYLRALINQYINSNQHEEAVKSLKEAIAQKPDDAQLYDVLGRVYENRDEIDAAIEQFEKALSLDSEYVESLGNIGRVYYNRGVEAQAAASNIADNKAYSEAFVKVKEHFNQSMPYYEKALELNPGEKEYMNPLRTIYYILGMGEKLEKIEKEMQ